MGATSPSRGGALGLQNHADYSARIKNSTSAIALQLVTGNTTYNSALDRSNTGGLVIGGGSGSLAQITLNGANAFTGDTILGGFPVSIVLGNKSAFGNGGAIPRRCSRRTLYSARGGTSFSVTALATALPRLWTWSFS